MTRWLSGDEKRTWENYVVSSLHLFSLLEAELKSEFDISHTDFGILVQLSFADNQRLRMSQLASTFRLERSVITYRVSRMEQRDLVRREDVASDGRGVSARLTEEGAALLAEVAPAHVNTVRAQFLDHLGAERIGTLADAFEALRSHQLDEAGEDR